MSFLFIVPAIPKLDGALIEKDKLRRVDVIGALLSLAWPAMLVFALEEAGQAYAWDSSQVIGTLTGSGVSLVAFGLYEIWVQRKGRQEPIFPVKFLKDPMLSLNILCVCFPFAFPQEHIQFRLINLLQNHVHHGMLLLRGNHSSSPALPSCQRHLGCPSRNYYAPFYNPVTLLFDGLWHASLQSAQVCSTRARWFFDHHYRRNNSTRQPFHNVGTVIYHAQSLRV